MEYFTSTGVECLLQTFIAIRATSKTVQHQFDRYSGLQLMSTLPYRR